MSIKVEQLKSILDKAIITLQQESLKYRPRSKNGYPGGLVLLDPTLLTCIIPDLHGRQGFLLNILNFKYKHQRILDYLHQGKIQIVCVGDGMHGESRVALRWRKAHQEYKDGFINCPNMAMEMNENFGTMFKIMQLKVKYPQFFHFLKGNHENILDENEHGNHPFAKFAAEGPMTKQYVKQFFGEIFLNQWDQFEKSLPLIAIGSNYVISHARPKMMFNIDQVIDYKMNPDLIEGLTWTRDQLLSKDISKLMLNVLLDSTNLNKFWFVGHTAIKEQYKHWMDEALVQIHNPDMQSIVILENGVCLDLKDKFHLVNT
jgi:hypothetical protein